MDVLAELTGMYLQRVTGVTVQKPAAGNWKEKVATHNKLSEKVATHNK